MDSSVKLTSEEVGVLWTQYLDDSMAICVLKQFLEHIDEGPPDNC